MQRPVSEKIYSPFQGIFQIELQTGEVEETLSAFELDKDVYVAFIGYLSPHNGAKEGGAFDPVLLQDLQRFLARGLQLLVHGSPIFKRTQSLSLKS
jgi:hypothetical protein